MQAEEHSLLIRSYAILVGRIIASLPSFTWLKKVLPKHIPHEHQDVMAQKSKVFAMPIQFKNEAKHEDCVDIMDNYTEYLESLHLEAFGTQCLARLFKIYPLQNKLYVFLLNYDHALFYIICRPQTTPKG